VERFAGRAIGVAVDAKGIREPTREPIRAASLQQELDATRVAVHRVDPGRRLGSTDELGAGQTQLRVRAPDDVVLLPVVDRDLRSRVRTKHPLDADVRVVRALRSETGSGTQPGGLFESWKLV